ncbi:MAG: DNA sulfur modification protein DndE [bacterium]|nr:DNA sulfur modification protein DndE [bacterium]
MSRHSIVDAVRVDERAKTQLMTLKRRTGIKNWNVLCRWALCASLAEPSIPADQEVGTLSNVEMSWSTFGGQAADIYTAIIQARCEVDGIPQTPDALAKQFRLHLHRGITYLVGTEDTKTLNGLISLAIKP